jgi:sugar lactone lactonase YvrE
MSRVALVLLMIVVLGCGHQAPRSTRAATAPAAVAVQLPVEPNGLWWNAVENALYFASDETHAVYRRDHAGNVKVVGSLPAPIDGNGGLGQLVITRDGTIVITRFGGGTAGGVIFLRRDGTSGSVPNLDPTRRRIGLAVGEDGTLFDAYFHVEEGMKKFRGAVARLTLDGGETDVIGGLQKPVGVLVDGNRVLASDQMANRIVQATLPALSDIGVVAANVDTPDLLVTGPNGSIFVASRSGAVFRAERDGSVATVISGLRAVRGVAFDPRSSRLFVVERGDRKEGKPATLHELAISQ